MNNPFSNNETVLYSFVFRINIFLFWIKANYWLTNSSLVVKKPTTIAFNSIPMGTTKITQPLKTIASVTTSNKFHLDRLLVGFLCISLILIVVTSLNSLGIKLTFNSSIEGMFFISALIAGLLGILSLLSLFAILNSYTTGFTIYNTGGQSIEHEFSILDKYGVESFASSLNFLI
ncbi:hypothetical protein [Methanolobus sp. ZRKC5]|uniref:hypothetical protein n=1 Tax=unclassified Methanolobus TaxID=2629569 RepID=UPI00313E4A9E